MVVSVIIIEIFMLMLTLSYCLSVWFRYTGWMCRSMVSATTYTLVGVVNKFLTVLLNTVLWDKHSSPFGIFAVCVCLLAGTLYQQAPRREEVRKSQSGGSAV
jgi:GDP-mannose transporter